MPGPGRRSVTASTGPPGRPRGRSRTSPNRTRSLLNRPHTCRQAMTDATVLDLDDIQAGALHERPSPYVGTYVLLRVNDRQDGRDLVSRLIPLLSPARSVLGRAA